MDPSEPDYTDTPQLSKTKKSRSKKSSQASPRMPSNPNLMHHPNHSMMMNYPLHFSNFTRPSHHIPTTSNHHPQFSHPNYTTSPQNFQFPVTQPFVANQANTGDGETGSQPHIHEINDDDFNPFPRYSTQSPNSYPHHSIPVGSYSQHQYSQVNPMSQYFSQANPNPQYFSQPNAHQQFYPQGYSIPQSQGGEKSGERWGMSEDIALIWAYIEAGGDTGIATDQKAKNLWETIVNKFHEAHLENPTEIQDRNFSQCSGRWKRIQYDVNRWISKYKEATRAKRSGESEDEVINAARLFWARDYGLPGFTLDYAWNILKKYPKWQGGKTAEDFGKTSGSGGSSKWSSQDMEGSSSVGVDFSTVRPEGIKKMKKNKKEKDQPAKSVESLTMAIENLNTMRGQEQQFDAERFALQTQMFEYTKERDRKRQDEKQEKRRFKMCSTLLAKPILSPQELEMFAKLHEAGV